MHREASSVSSPAKKVSFQVEDPELEYTPNAYKAGEAVIQQGAQVISATGEAILDGSKVVAGALRDGGVKLVGAASADIHELGADITSEFAKLQFTPHAGESCSDVVGRLWFLVFLMIIVLIIAGATIYIFVYSNGMYLLRT